MVDPIVLDDALERVYAFLEGSDLDGAVDYLRQLHPADSAEILAELEPEEQAAIVERLQAPELAEFFEQLDEDDMAEVAQHLDLETLADVLDEMEPDMAADLLGELEPGQAADLLEEMEEPDDVATLMSYPPDSAGGIMTAAPPSLRRFWTVAESIQFLKQQYQEEEDFFYLYVLDRYCHLIGLVNLRALILAEPEQTIEEIMNRNVISVKATADQEEVAQLLQRYDLVSLPVVDDNERLIGIVTIDDVVDVIEEEATEDIYRLAQVSPDSEIYSPVHQSVRNRLPWLVVNLGTAFLASSVVALFQDTIAQAAILAAFMPIVAGQGGNAGTQTMTIVVRSLALKEIEP
ncbi:MAG: magnesium transporter, partial [Caldilineaceae bacterium]|nr:magnesium transporter [Caldilineaceae bacterium]